MGLRKRDSKRRWVKRFHLGKDVPFKEVMEHGLIRRFERAGIESEYYPNKDVVRKKWLISFKPKQDFLKAGTWEIT